MAVFNISSAEISATIVPIRDRNAVIKLAWEGI
jgi:hypothetical protein